MFDALFAMTLFIALLVPLFFYFKKKKKRRERLHDDHLLESLFDLRYNK